MAYEEHFNFQYLSNLSLFRKTCTNINTVYLLNLLPESLVTTDILSIFAFMQSIFTFKEFQISAL